MDYEEEHKLSEKYAEEENAEKNNAPPARNLQHLFSQGI